MISAILENLRNAATEITKKRKFTVLAEKKS